MNKNEEIDPYDGIVKAIDTTAEYHLDDRFYKFFDEVNNEL
jgi:hypothetical protein